MSSPKESKKCFVIMSFDEELSDVYHQAIGPAAQNLGYDAFRIDRPTHPGNIPAEIIQRRAQGLAKEKRPDSVDEDAGRAAADPAVFFTCYKPSSEIEA